MTEKMRALTDRVHDYLVRMDLDPDRSPERRDRAIPDWESTRG